MCIFPFCPTLLLRFITAMNNNPGGMVIGTDDQDLQLEKPQQCRMEALTVKPW